MIVCLFPFGVVREVDRLSSPGCTCPSDLHGSQVLLQSWGEDLVDEAEGLPVTPEDVLPAPEGAFVAKAPVYPNRNTVRTGSRCNHITASADMFAVILQHGRLEKQS